MNTPDDDEIDEDELAEELAGEIPDFKISPEEHARLKNKLFTSDFGRLKRFDERYLVCGSGSNGDAATRRDTAYDILDSRDDATAFKLEDFGFTGEDMDLWWRGFDILCGRATKIAVVIEDFHGGYASEMAYLWRDEYRARTWLVTRIYDDEATMREQYDDPMARSCSIAFAREGRVFEWDDPSAFREAVERIP